MRPIIPPPLQGLLIASAMWGATHILPSTGYTFSHSTHIAALFFLMGFIIDGASILEFIRAKTTINPLTPNNTKKLVVKGFYKISRNPMYLGMFFLLLGWAIWLSNLIAFIGPILFVGTITTFQIKPEESALRKKFGADYDTYCAKVRRWL